MQYHQACTQPRLAPDSKQLLQPRASLESCRDAGGLLQRRHVIADRLEVLAESHRDCRGRHTNRSEPGVPHANSPLRDAARYGRCMWRARRGGRRIAGGALRAARYRRCMWRVRHGGRRVAGGARCGRRVAGGALSLIHI
eukprot:2970728-Prymnesium_polylepis.1